jgi:hypothetical protein
MQLIIFSFTITNPNNIVIEIIVAQLENKY